jgi:hypothetical protein
MGTGEGGDPKRSATKRRTVPVSAMVEFENEERKEERLSASKLRGWRQGRGGGVGRIAKADDLEEAEGEEASDGGGEGGDGGAEGEDVEDGEEGPNVREAAVVFVHLGGGELEMVLGGGGVTSRR